MKLHRRFALDIIEDDCVESDLENSEPGGGAPPALAPAPLTPTANGGQGGAFFKIGADYICFERARLQCLFANCP